MNTAGKSDILEAVIQMLVLRALHKRGARRSPWLVKEVRRKSQGISSMEEQSVHIALGKLESSGWIRRKSTAAGSDGRDRWELTSAASRCLPREMGQWEAFIRDAPRIFGLLRADFR